MSVNRYELIKEQKEDGRKGRKMIKRKAMLKEMLRYRGNEPHMLKYFNIDQPEC